MGLLLLLGVTVESGLAQSGKPELVDVRRIWDAAPHNAFTDLVRFQNKWFCVFREGKGHVSPDGALRVITSTDGKDWQSAAIIRSEDSDLRDAKITITPKGQLMLSGAEAMNRVVDHKHQSLTWFSDDGKTWSEQFEVGDKDVWLWRTTWHADRAWGFGYGTQNRKGLLRLYSSDSGQKYETVIDRVPGVGTYANETSLVFEKDGTAWCLLRQDGRPNTGLIGKSVPPYREWSWKPLGVRIGGPHMVRLPNGRFIATVRLYDGGARTSVCEIEPEAGRLSELLKLPSGGDTSYAGQIWHDGQLWISYYSSHEGKTSIYLARVRFEDK